MVYFVPLKAMKILDRILYMALLVILLSSNAFGNNKPLEYYQEGLDLLKSYAGRTEVLIKAQDLFIQALEIDENFALAYVGLGWVSYYSAYISGNKYDNRILINKALPLAEKAIQLDPNLAAGYRLRANLLTSLKKLSKAERDAKKSIELEPNDARSHQVLSYVYELQGKIDLSRVEREKAMSLQKSEFEKWRYYERLARQYENEGNYSLAEEYYLKVIELKPNSAWAYGNYGSFLIAKGDLRKAEKMVKKAMGIMDYGMAHKYLGEIYFQRGKKFYDQGKLKKAESEFLISIAKFKDRNASCYYLSRIYAEKDNCEEAVKFSKLILLIDPQDKYAIDLIEKCNK
jgi:tetratricopeptide (TPR) repeat protein